LTAKLRKAPAFVTPMAALRVEKLPAGKEWLYELKWDGYRALLIKDGGEIELRSRNDKDLTAMYPAIVAAATSAQHAPQGLSGYCHERPACGRAPPFVQKFLPTICH
jgi:ATP-dependent DNA ligase